MALMNSLFQRSTSSGGMRAGPTTAAHEVIENRGSPASAKVGTCGSAALRLGRVTARARSLPSRMCGSTVPPETTITWVRPASRSVRAWGSPL